MSPIITLIILTFLPFLELRASIPYGLFQTDLSWFSVFLICVLANIALAPLLYFFLDKIIRLFLKVRLVEKYYQKTIAKAQTKVKRYVDKYGIWGLAVFIGIPLPGTGVYTAALGAYFLGFKFKDFFKAAIIGVLIAGTIVMLISISGNSLFSFLIKKD